MLPKSYIESYLNNEKFFKEDNLSEGDDNDDNEVTRSTNKLRKKKSDSDILRNYSSNNAKIFRRKKFGSFKKMAKIKGILKTSRRSMSKNNSDFINNRKVTFGWREESF